VALEAHRQLIRKSFDPHWPLSIQVLLPQSCKFIHQYFTRTTLLSVHYRSVFVLSPPYSCRTSSFIPKRQRRYSRTHWCRNDGCTRCRYERRLGRPFFFRRARLPWFHAANTQRPCYICGKAVYQSALPTSPPYSPFRYQIWHPPFACLLGQ
jgi:hypothetical protein